MMPQEADDPGPRLAILFWFYKALDTCEDRLRQLRALNPGTAIYGLYGGAPEGAAAAADRLGPLLDDHYAFAEARDDAWKWHHGDQLIAAWYRDRGRDLPWDTVVIVQWDMLVLRPVDELFGGLARDEALFSGLRPAAEVEGWWGWLKPATPEKGAHLAAFKDWLRERHGGVPPLWCCLFIVACLPRSFLDRYLADGPPEAGFLEYKLPTLAHLYGTRLCTDHPFVPWWAADPATRNAPPEARILNAMGADVPLEVVVAEHAAGRAHVFHPFRGDFPAPADGPR
ncbi:hypothetical protein [Methylobacterium sp. A54F]